MSKSRTKANSKEGDYLDNIEFQVEGEEFDKQMALSNSDEGNNSEESK